MNIYNNWLVNPVFLILTLYQQVSSFTNKHEYYTINRYISGIKSSSRLQPLSSSNDDDWGFDDVDDSIDNNEDPRLQAMKSLLESSWDAKSMGVIPTDPQNGAEAAGECVASALANNKNILMIDLRLPSYDITEGRQLYDILSVYDFCTFLSDNLKQRNLIRKSLLLVRNEKERAEIDRVLSQRGELTTTTEVDDDNSEAWQTSSEESSEVDDFRKQLMSSWDDDTSSGDNDTRAEDEKAVSKTTPQQKISDNNNSSHRLCSMVGNIEIGTGPDSFDQVIDAVDQNAILNQDEDALIIMSPYTTQDVIAIRRTLARYGNTRTIIIVNSRIEQIPRELDPGLLVYGVMPLIARSKESDNESGLKVVVMKRYPEDWSVYVDVYDDGFVEARGPTQHDISDKAFPSSEWITQRVEAHVQGLPSNKDK